MKILAANIPIFNKILDDWFKSTILDFDDYIKKIYDIKISNNPDIPEWKYEFFEFKSEEDYFLFY